MLLKLCTCALLVLSAILCAEGSAVARAASLPSTVRVGDAGDLVGTFRILARGSTSTDSCPTTIEHTRADGDDAIPHSAIRHEGSTCTSSGSLSRLSASDFGDAISTITGIAALPGVALPGVLPTDVGDLVRDVFVGRERTSRECPVKPFRAGTVVVVRQVSSSLLDAIRLLDNSVQEGDRVMVVLSAASGDTPALGCLYVAPALPGSGDSGDDGVCFPAGATVRLKDGLEKPVSELQLGDTVHVGGAEHSEVFMFTHRLADATHEFVRLTTRAGALTATPGHYVYVNNKLTAAGAARVGDTLTRADGTPAEIIRVQKVRATGLYNPQTLHGDIVVDGFRASTFTTAVEPTLADALLAPLRGLHRLGFKLDRISQLFDRGAGAFVRWVPKGFIQYS